MRFGDLEFSPVTEHYDLVARPVADFLKSIDASGVEVSPIDPQLSDTAAFCEKYGISAEVSANCVVLEAKRADRRWFAACLILASTRADINGVARRALAARRVSFAPMDEAVRVTGMEYGAITPLGLPADWQILIDKRVQDADRVILGSGVRGSKLLVPGSFLTSIPGASVIEGLALQVEKDRKSTRLNSSHRL